MKFVTIFKLKPDNIEKILQRMENIEMPKGIRILGEWLGSNRDVLVYEAENNEAVNRLLHGAYFRVNHWGYFLTEKE